VLSLQVMEGHPRGEGLGGRRSQPLISLNSLFLLSSTGVDPLSTTLNSSVIVHHVIRPRDQVHVAYLEYPKTHDIGF
jgi:hypothetical protein